MHLLITAATGFELAGIQARWPAGTYTGAAEVRYLVSGVGPVLSAVATTEAVLAERPDLVLNVGIAGAFDRELALGEVVHVTHDSFGDLGVEERDGSFTGAVALGLLDANEPPFVRGQLVSSSPFAFAKQVVGVTNATVHGSAERIARFRERSEAQVESMEGAAVAYVALRQNLPHVQLRAISNYVEPRDRANWKIGEALAALTEAVDALIAALPGASAARSARRQLGR